MSELKNVDVAIGSWGVTPSSVASPKDLWSNTVLRTTLNVDAGVYEPFEPIKGQMITAEMRIGPHEVETLDAVDLKNMMISRLVTELMNGKHIEFTKQQDVSTMEIIIRARIFATPDDKVRIIRKANNV